MSRLNSMSNSRSNRQTRKNKKGGQNKKDVMTEQYRMLIDRGISESDGQATAIQDSQNMTRSVVPPIMIPRAMANQIHWFRASTISSFNSSTSLPVFAGINFTLNSISGVTAYQDLFDQYAIVAAVVRVFPDSSNNIYTNTGLLLTVIDYDDSNTPTSLNNLRDYSTLVETKANVGQTRVIYPQLAEASYSGAFTSFVGTRAWCDIASPSIQHYGIKIGVDATSNVTPFVIDTTLIFCCRSNR